MTIEQWAAVRERFGPALCRMRAKHGYTLRELASRSHVDQSTLSRLERSQRQPRRPTAEAIAKALGMSIEEMIA